MKTGRPLCSHLPPLLRLPGRQASSRARRLRHPSGRQVGLLPRFVLLVFARHQSLVVALVLCALTALAEGSCPSGEFVYPCTCSETFIGNYVMCSLVDEENLILPFQYLRDYNVSRLFLSNVSSSLNAGIFMGLKVGTFKVADSRFKVEEDRPATHRGRGTRIQNLQFMRCYLDAGPGFFGNLDRLEALSLLNSTVVRFSREWLGSLVNLTHLVVEAVTFHELGIDALADLQRLTTLVWASNGARFVSRQFFPRRASYLVSIDLSDNKLTSLPPDMFDNMPVLMSVTLSHNRFKTLPPTPWRPMMRQLSHVTLDDNPIVCNANISWLLESDTRHKVSGTCEEPASMHGVRIDDLDASRLPR